ncbi:MAG: methylenetetrahydrofolate reductase [NAD(P)H] [Planctomycetia bacterium]|nr:methylenetetrahydrofolate reductase [NAD(P)H] [Planctomycetia bacterium]
MRIRDIYGPGKFGLSFEIFPPKTPDGDGALWENVSRLASFKPAFISCTYGAGGTTRTRTIELCQEIQRRLGVAATAHFTCLGGTLPELREWLALARDGGIANIMALRGDPPAGQTQFQHVAGGLKHANELVALIKSEFPNFGIGVAGYPEKHPEAPSLDVDLANLQRKVAAGGEAVYTQVFFENEGFLRFRDRCEKLKIAVPVIPGIMPILNFAQIKRITSMCGAALPAALAGRLEAAQEDKDAQIAIGVEYAIAQCRDLVARGIPGIHFYVLNRSQACEAILKALGHS